MTFVPDRRGIDATVALAATLGELSHSSQFAADAPNGLGLYKYLNAGLASPVSGAYEDLVIELLSRLSIWWHPGLYAVMPVMTPWCVRDRSCRYDQGPESWGAPRADAYLRDDNSIIKKLPLSSAIVARDGHLFAGHRPWRGFTACHIWRDLGDQRVAGEDPGLYSFVPNLVWLPSGIAPLTDRQGSWVQALLQRTSRRLFSGQPVASSVAAEVQYAWAQLPPPADGPALEVERLALFAPDAKFVARRVAYLDKFVAGCDDVLAARQINKKVVSSRYAPGLRLLDPAAVLAFRARMGDYAQRVRSAAAAQAA